MSPLLLVPLRDAPPPLPRRQDPAPPPFPREGPGIGAAPQGLQPDSGALTLGAPYKGMVGEEREAGISGPTPRSHLPPGLCRAPPLCRITSVGRGLLTSGGVGVSRDQGAIGLPAPLLNFFPLHNALKTVFPFLLSNTWKCFW